MALKLPPTYLFKTRFDVKDLLRLEKEIGIVRNPYEAEIFLGNVSRIERAKFELRSLSVNFEDIITIEDGIQIDGDCLDSPLLYDKTEKREKKSDVALLEGEETTTQDSSTDSDTASADQPVQKKAQTPLSNQSTRAHGSRYSKKLGLPLITAKAQTESLPGHHVKVLNFAWYTDSLGAGQLLPMEFPYLIYQCRVLPEGTKSSPSRTTNLSGAPTMKRPRAKTPPRSQTSPHSRRATTSSASQKRIRHSHLVHEDTSDHEHELNMPPLPEYLKTRYCCQRPTPMHSPNDAFIEQLKIIRKARELESNEVVGHDYSTKSYAASIAAIAAYPYTLTSTKEVARLPACGAKVVAAWQEWKEYGEIEEVKEIEANERLQCLSLFYGIHQVGEATAREFHDKHGWRDLDDIITNGWSTLKRDQQIGLKYYDELALRIPRKEVAATGDIILSHANAMHPGFKICIVGGYRRGKSDSGDMDFILSHPNEDLTKNLLGHLLDKLGSDHGSGWITHELTVSTKNSDRGQQTLAWRGAGKKAGKRSGFDTLDHAFVVWQNPHFEADEKNGGKNPNVHRRVDIIISPWCTAGCAVLGWTGGTMFERDLRSYCRSEKGWKFDSSGVRSVAEGTWIDLETTKGDVPEEISLEEKERRVFEGLGLEYRKPTERCTH